MSYYYKYNFTSPEGIYANIKEELRSYFDSGAVDPTWFPIWVDKCLQKLGKSSYQINQALLHISNFEAVVPDDFTSVREAWMCTSIQKEVTLPNSEYVQVKATSTRLDTPDLYCNQCTECAVPDVIQAIFKTTHTVAFTTTKKYLLKPGNITPSNCPENLFCANMNSASLDSYDVRGNKFKVTFREGVVYLQYYAILYDKDGYSNMIPDDFRVKEYIEAFIKQKIFEQIFNQTTDESFNQSQAKYQHYKQLADEAYIMADTENKKEDVYRKERAIKRTQNRNNRFNLH